MTGFLRNSSLYPRSPYYQLFIALIFILVVGGLVLIALLLTGRLIFNPGSALLNDPSVAAGENDISFLRYMLIVQHLSLFVFPGIILIAKLKKPGQDNYPELKIPGLTEIVYVAILAFCLFPVTGITGEFNSGMKLPEWMSGVEKWMRTKEDIADKLFEAIMTQDNAGTLIMNFIMAAVLPAIGEELIFRGIIQRIFTGIFRSGHLAIWITAFLFSALHFQFYGFIPRLILGLAYGYLFFWSGILWFPVIAHFINNAVSITGFYIQNADVSLIPDKTNIWFQLLSLPIPVLAVIIVLNYFRKKAMIAGMQEKETENPGIQEY